MKQTRKQSQHTTRPSGNSLTKSQDNKSRLLFADLLRGLAMIIMVEVHVVNSMMNPALREEPWFHFLNFINGLVAPSFIFISGFAFTLASRKKITEFRKLRYAFWKQAGRIALIWLAGYSLHIPFLSITKCRNLATHDHWLKFYGVDALQCIALGLSIVFILRLIIKSDKLFLSVMALLGIGAVIPAPLAYTIDFTRYMPFPVASYITPIHYTNFPVLPWFGFMSAGVLSAWFYTDAMERSSETSFMNILAVSGAVMVFAGLPLMIYLKDALNLFQDVRPNILFFTGRLGCVWLLLWLCHHFSRNMDEIHALILYPSRQSLVVYFLHLQILYREVWFGQSIIALGVHNLGIWACLLVSAGLLAVVLPVAGLWDYCKERWAYFGRAAVAVMIIGGIVIFFLR